MYISSNLDLAPTDTVQTWCLSPLNDDILIGWEDRSLWLHPGLKPEYDVLGAIIHELGHLCASATAPILDKNEFAFLGWEWQLAKRLKLESAWLACVQEVGLGSGAETWGLPESDEDVRCLLAERRHVAVELGLLTRSFRCRTLLRPGFIL